MTFEIEEYTPNTEELHGKRGRRRGPLRAAIDNLEPGQSFLVSVSDIPGTTLADKKIRLSQLLYVSRREQAITDTGELNYVDAEDGDGFRIYRI